VTPQKACCFYQVAIAYFETSGIAYIVQSRPLAGILFGGAEKIFWALPNKK